MAHLTDSDLRVLYETAFNPGLDSLTREAAAIQLALLAPGCDELLTCALLATGRVAGAKESFSHALQTTETPGIDVAD